MIMTILCLVLIVSFNRYMVECECSRDRTQLNSVWVLIDTLWNVNKLLK